MEQGLTTEKSFRSKSTRNRIVFTMHRLIWNQTDVRLVSNQLVHGKYNLICVWFNKIWKRFLCVFTPSGIVTRKDQMYSFPRGRGHSASCGTIKAPLHIGRTIANWFGSHPPLIKESCPFPVSGRIITTLHQLRDKKKRAAIYRYWRAIQTL